MQVGYMRKICLLRNIQALDGKVPMKNANYVLVWFFFPISIFADFLNDNVKWYFGLV